MFTPTQSSNQPVSTWLLLAVVIGGLFYLGGQYIVSQPQRVKQEAEANREISVQGTGTVTTPPDIASVTLGVNTGPRSTAKEAMSLLTQKFNNVLQAVRSEGIKDEDIKAQNVSVNPVYDYTEGKQTLRGFEATESIRVKIRDFDKIGTVLAKTTAEGVNQVGGVSFEIDNPEGIQLQAQQKAIADARKRAEELAKSMGVHLGKVKTFTTSSNGVMEPAYKRSYAADSVSSMGGAAPVPIEVPSGSQEVNATVTITYSLL